MMKKHNNDKNKRNKDRRGSKDNYIIVLQKQVRFRAQYQIWNEQIDTDTFNRENKVVGTDIYKREVQIEGEEVE